MSFSNKRTTTKPSSSNNNNMTQTRNHNNVPTGGNYYGKGNQAKSTILPYLASAKFPVGQENMRNDKKAYYISQMNEHVLKCGGSFNFDLVFLSACSLSTISSSSSTVAAEDAFRFMKVNVEDLLAQAPLRANKEIEAAAVPVSAEALKINLSQRTIQSLFLHSKCNNNNEHKSHPNRSCSSDNGNSSSINNSSSSSSSSSNWWLRAINQVFREQRMKCSSSKPSFVMVVICAGGEESTTAAANSHHSKKNKNKNKKHQSKSPKSAVSESESESKSDLIYFVGACPASNARRSDLVESVLSGLSAISSSQGISVARVSSMMTGASKAAPLASNERVSVSSFKPQVRSQLKLKEHIWITKKCTQYMYDSYCSESDNAIWQKENGKRPSCAIHSYLNYKFAQHVIAGNVLHVSYSNDNGNSDEFLVFGTDLQTNKGIDIYLIAFKQSTFGREWSIDYGSVYDKLELARDERFSFLVNGSYLLPTNTLGSSAVDASSAADLVAMVKDYYQSQVNCNESADCFWRSDIRHKNRYTTVQKRRWTNSEIHQALLATFAEAEAESESEFEDDEKATTAAAKNITVLPMLFIDSKRQQCHLEYLLPLIKRDNSGSRLSDVIGLSFRVVINKGSRHQKQPRSSAVTIQFQSLYYCLNEILSNIRLVRAIPKESIILRHLSNETIWLKSSRKQAASIKKQPQPQLTNTTVVEDETTDTDSCSAASEAYHAYNNNGNNINSNNSNYNYYLRSQTAYNSSDYYHQSLQLNQVFNVVSQLNLDENSYLLNYLANGANVLSYNHAHLAAFHSSLFTPSPTPSASNSAISSMSEDSCFMNNNYNNNNNNNNTTSFQQTERYNESRFEVESSMKPILPERRPIFFCP